MMKYQRGLTLTSLLFWGMIIVFVSVGGMKVVPAYVENLKLNKDIKATVNQVGPEATVAELKAAFSKYMQVDHMDFRSEDLIITRKPGGVVLSYAYERKIHLFFNVSVLIEFSGSSAD